MDPICTFKGHSTEGYAMDWSSVVVGRLATGDCNGGIHLWDVQEGREVGSTPTWNVSPAPYSGHTGSVEDIQWSPNEANVFVSCSVDQTIQVWDSRNFGSSMISVKAHDADINVISWNTLAPFLLASGCDDGSFKVWDFRAFKPYVTPLVLLGCVCFNYPLYVFVVCVCCGSDAPVAHFNWHKQPITSIEWRHDDENEIVVASADNTVRCVRVSSLNELLDRVLFPVVVECIYCYC